jgi:hypothetical protein
MMSAARLRMRPRAIGLIAAHSFCARLAEAMARSTMAGVAACSLAITSPVAGKMLSNGVPAVSSTYTPSMKCEACGCALSVVMSKSP